MAILAPIARFDRSMHSDTIPKQHWRPGEGRFGAEAENGWRKRKLKSVPGAGMAQDGRHNSRHVFPVGCPPSRSATPTHR